MTGHSVAPDECPFMAGSTHLLTSPESCRCRLQRQLCETSTELVLSANSCRLRNEESRHSNVRFARRIQPVDAIVFWNRSAGVS
jgi:hypothetical protein